jgi:hypothetical protein
MTVRPTRSTGLHYAHNQQLHEERFITYEPRSAVQANPATSEYLLGDLHGDATEVGDLSCANKPSGRRKRQPEARQNRISFAHGDHVH